MFLEELHFHEIPWNERSLVSFLAQQTPVDIGKPRVLLDFSNWLGSLARVFCKQAFNQVAQKHFGWSISWDSNESIIWLAICERSITMVRTASKVDWFGLSCDDVWRMKSTYFQIFLANSRHMNESNHVCLLLPLTYKECAQLYFCGCLWSRKMEGHQPQTRRASNRRPTSQTTHCTLAWGRIRVASTPKCQRM